MNARGTPSTEMEDQQVCALIETLHQTGHRLEELTAGEVDGVADGEGRTFLLQAAQDQVRQSAAVKQAGILDAFRANIALLDARGLIVSVNEGWRAFASANAMPSPGHGIGSDYLEICDRAEGDDSSEARAAAHGIRAVLRGEATKFSLEYPCHSPAEQRWFLMSVAPLAGTPPSGALVMHQNITVRKLDQEEMLRFGAAMDAVPDAIYLTDRASMGFVHVNLAACRMHNRTREQLLALGPADLLPTSRAELERIYDAIIASGEDDPPQEMVRVRGDGSPVWVEVRRHAHRMGERWMIVSLVRDITERMDAGVRIKRLNRVHAVRSSISSVIVRAGDRDGLFRQASRIAVEQGGFSMAWVGLLDKEAGILKPVASAGDVRDFFDTSHLEAAHNRPGGAGLAGRAVREMKPMIANDVRHDPGVLRRKALEERGIRSAAYIPLIVGEAAIGVLALYSSDEGFFDAEEVRLLEGLGGDISFAVDHIAKGELIDYLAYYDALTGLANRTLFLERVAQYLRGAAGANQKLAVILIDLERFRNINDTLGRTAGDLLLKQVGEWLTRSTGDATLLARVGTDDFAIVLPEVKQERDIAELIEKLSEAFLNHPFPLGEATFRVAFKAGAAVFPDDGATADILFKHAEAALKKAQSSGARYLFYTQKMTETAAGKLSLENQLRQALDRGEFVLHYQPKVNLASGKLTGAEALIRWNDPRSGLVPPGKFIPVLEETGLIHDVGRWALRQALEDYLRWRAAGLPAVRIAVNVSPLQLRSRAFIGEIMDAIRIDPHATAGLELEITESVIMEDVKLSIASLQAIRSTGVTIAIDDFGTGFSSLSYLARLPVDTLKIDRSFVVDMAAGPEGLALVSTIINLAHSLKLKVVAEGVETEEQSRLLRMHDCDEMQGFLYSKPVPGEIFEERFLAP